MFVKNARRHSCRRDFTTFVADASTICQEEYGHPLILYIRIDSRAVLASEDMVAVGGSVGCLASDLSYKTSSAKVIVEVSKSGMSDRIQADRPGHFTSFHLDGMTEDEFVEVGKAVLRNPKDPQGLLDPFLRHRLCLCGDRRPDDGHTRRPDYGQPRNQQAYEITLAVREEVADLEAAECRVIQREPQPLKSEAAYMRWSMRAFRL